MIFICLHLNSPNNPLPLEIPLLTLFIQFLMRSLKQYIKNLFNTHQPSEKIRQQAYEQITLSLNKAFALPSLRQYSQTLSLRGLLVKAVEMFVGSRSMPKNLNLARYLLKLAEQRAQTDREKDEIQYYKYFFLRIQAFKNGQVVEFQLSTEMLSKLAEEKGHPQACYLAGKQLMTVAETSSPEERKKMVKLAAQYFVNSLTENQFGGLFYLAQIMKNEEYSHMTKDEVREFYIYGAALGDPMCYFQMAQIYREQGKEQLYFKYLKMAAESGIMEAQHNLGCEYLDGKIVAKDEIKALAWFIHAAAFGFVQAKYNVIYLFLKGSECGRIKANRKVALLNLHQLHKQGEPVEDKIKELMVEEEKSKQKEGVKA